MSIPHAVTTVTRGSNTDSYEYDSNGNTLAPDARAGVTCRIEKGVTYLQTYNGENRLAGVKKLATGTCAQPLSYAAEWDFAYDGDGVRTATMTTEYVDGLPQPVEVTQYYFGGTPPIPVTAAR